MHEEGSAETDRYLLERIAIEGVAGGVFLVDSESRNAYAHRNYSIVHEDDNRVSLAAEEERRRGIALEEVSYGEEVGGLDRESA